MKLSPSDTDEMTNIVEKAIKYEKVLRMQRALRGKSAPKEDRREKRRYAFACSENPFDLEQKPQVVCQYCKRTGHEASQCPKIRSNTASQTVCYACGLTGHIKRECKNIVCQICSKSGHTAETCFRVKQTGANVIKCQFCSQPGHLAVSCPKIASVQYGTVCNSDRHDTNKFKSQCQMCDQVGHGAKNCPLLEANNA